MVRGLVRRSLGEGGSAKRGRTLLRFRHAPRHPLREVPLKVRPPPADRLARIPSRLGGRVAKPSVLLADELPTPAWLRRVGGIVPTERQEEEPRWRVSFLQTAVRVGGRPGLGRVQRAERAAAAHVLVDPGTAGQRRVTGEVHAAIHGVAEVATGRRFREDVVHAGKLGAHPVGDPILIADVVDAQLAHERGQPRRSAILFHSPQRLREVGLPAPDGDVQWAIRSAGVNAGSQRPRRRRVVAGANVLAAAMRVARHHPFAERCGRRPPRGVPLEVRQHFAVRVDNLANELRARDRLFHFTGCAGAGGDQQLEIELVRVHHQANHGLLVVGIRADVRQDGKARPLRGAEHGDRCVESGGIREAGEAGHPAVSGEVHDLQHARPCGRLAQHRLERANHARDEGREALFGRLAGPLRRLRSMSPRARQ